MKYFLLLMLSLIMSGAFAQKMEVRIKSSVNKPTYEFEIQEPNIEIEGYDGDQVILQLTPMGREELPAEAAGLKRIPIVSRDRKREINILNPKVKEDSSRSRMIITIPPCNCGKVTIKVPKDSILSVRPDVFSRDGRLFIKDIDNEVQIVGFFPVIELNNVAGFIFSTGGNNILATNKIILSNIKWTDRPVMFNGKLRPRYYQVSSTSASVFLKLPENLSGNLLYSSSSGVITSSLTTRFSDEMMPDPTQMRQFTGDSRVDPKLRFRKLNQGGIINIQIRTETGNIHFNMEDEK